MSGSVCQILDWDSSFFGFPVARVAARRASAATMQQAISWARDHRVRSLQLLVDADDAESARAATDAGMYVTDVRVTLSLDWARVPARSEDSGLVRTWMESDIPRLRQIAADSHHQSRFYADPVFSREQCDRLYATWVENSCRGYAQAVLVTGTSVPTGYITCHRGTDGSAHIGLVAVDAAERGRGLGETLLHGAAEWMGRGATVTVVTQGRNTSAMRWYERFGFVTRSMQLWLHLGLDT